ncbi:o-succinylbenzoate--CoA ligase [[Haemophilus] ducreyi]|uniref:o-succinylbenzoate--CoA ligase n=1 Tax=Haemophilus ducreyi TaxID=730 RepID=UPI0006561D4E|nr:o-succinylbenzoate--CoA ligase [[Haemophilus] ducreyi]AKO45516.1 O-succinylbenzoic acid--CoA ligase [[Haemophilus] ducreyi]AKO46903.1 O-succinylbenzoic acid--CoA ligase [[Haemophilus] ducreyi]AKO48243.1 O-succinylbenzoic acid--CoA ligase [[Haemophilus] ducreyi]AKO49634.1 O-succinylbenzoic acid--CoA ligase [[Haemophilus] ducreyi]ANF62546.1 o-succinylbenzoate--CoA ligase [[Haemophilus] ducreyi]
MVTFSLFPTAYWAEQKAQESAIIWQKGKQLDATAVPHQLSWADFHQTILKTAQYFHVQGITSAKLIAYSGQSKFNGLLCYCTALAIGVPILMLNPALNEGQRQAILSDNQVEFLITDQLFKDLLADILPQTTAYSLSELNIDQPATLTLTSGSTGSPKAVVHSIRNHLENAVGVCQLMHFTQTDCWLLSLPLFHVSGQGIVWRWLLQGATLYLNDAKAQFFDCLANVSHASLVPTQLQRYLKERRTNTLKQKFLLGGSAIPATLIQQAQQQGITTYAGYGMTEMASTICAVENEIDNVGRPLAGRSIRIVKNEIWVKGAGLALGYWQKNGEIQPLVNQQGWLQTKDCGKWNQQSQLVVKGRLDNMFISGGENIQPEEIEQLIYQSSWVQQVFVLPKEDSEFGQRPVAVIQFNSGDFTENVTKLMAWLTDKLEKFKLPIAYYPLNMQDYEQQGNIKIARQQVQTALTKLLRKN